MRAVAAHLELMDRFTLHTPCICLVLMQCLQPPYLASTNASSTTGDTPLERCSTPWSRSMENSTRPSATTAPANRLVPVNHDFSLSLSLLVLIFAHYCACVDVLELRLDTPLSHAYAHCMQQLHASSLLTGYIKECHSSI